MSSPLNIEEEKKLLQELFSDDEMSNLAVSDDEDIPSQSTEVLNEQGE